MIILYAKTVGDVEQPKQSSDLVMANKDDADFICVQGIVRGSPYSGGFFMPSNEIQALNEARATINQVCNNFSPEDVIDILNDYGSLYQEAVMQSPAKLNKETIPTFNKIASVILGLSNELAQDKIQVEDVVSEFTKNAFPRHIIPRKIMNNMENGYERE